MSTEGFTPKFSSIYTEVGIPRSPRLPDNFLTKTFKITRGNYEQLCK